MDFNDLDTTKASNTGRFLHLEFNGKKLYTEDSPPKPIGFMVKGAGSAEFRGREKKMRAARMERIRLQRGGKIRGLEGADDEQRELYASTVTSYVNCLVGGKPMPETATLEETLGMFERFRWIEDQVVAFVDDETNWLGEA